MSTNPVPSSMTSKPIFSKSLSLHAENNHFQFGVSGGLIDVGTKIDHTLYGADRFVGRVLGVHPKVYIGELEINLFFLRRLWAFVQRTRNEQRCRNWLLLIDIGSASSIQVERGQRSREDPIDFTRMH
ncbi:hypothetical protein EV702DRAFT_361144 [Suillus placidus]|uniref:Uncharacterized protein n=1 Tax=Suillus placidus TaxID=48579 RepID=A0A9P6ZTL4_9AGAM|nr:hypothetical protein EV702DRAFT_361144 [Suillus placidus]